MCAEITLVTEKTAVTAFSIRLVEACHRVSVLRSPPIPKDRLFLPKKLFWHFSTCSKQQQDGYCIGNSPEKIAKTCRKMCSDTIQRRRVHSKRGSVKLPRLERGVFEVWFHFHNPRADMKWGLREGALNQPLGSSLISFKGFKELEIFIQVSWQWDWTTEASTQLSVQSVVTTACFSSGQLPLAMSVLLPASVCLFSEQRVNRTILLGFSTNYLEKVLSHVSIENSGLSIFSFLLPASLKHSYSVVSSMPHLQL